MRLDLQLLQALRGGGGERRLLLILIALLLAVLVVLLAPRAAAPAVVEPAGFIFPREPDIRVRVGTLDPGESLTIGGVSGRDQRDGKLTVTNQGGEAFLDKEPSPTPVILAPSTQAGLGIGDRRFGGEILVVSEPDARKLHLVNRVPLELYLEGVVLSEMPPDYPDEALYAQTIASRSYAAWQLLVRRSRLWDVTDTQRSQVYRGAPTKLLLARRLVSATRGLGLTWEGRVIEAVFSSTCGGTTRGAEEAFGDPSVPPLAGVTCGLCGGTQFSSWMAKVRRGDGGRVLALGGPITAVDNAMQFQSARLASITIRGQNAEKQLTPNQFRDLLGASCRSTWFTRIEIEGDYLVAEGRGFGHGVGMCQVGAQKLANARQDHRAILQHYYPGARIALLYAIAES